MEKVSFCIMAKWLRMRSAALGRAVEKGLSVCLSQIGIFDGFVEFHRIFLQVVEG